MQQFIAKWSARQIVDGKEANQVVAHKWEVNQISFHSQGVNQVESKQLVAGSIWYIVYSQGFNQVESKQLVAGSIWYIVHSQKVNQISVQIQGLNQEAVSIQRVNQEAIHSQGVNQEAAYSQEVNQIDSSQLGVYQIKSSYLTKGSIRLLDGYFIAKVNQVDSTLLRQQLSTKRSNLKTVFFWRVHFCTVTRNLFSNILIFTCSC